MNFFNTFLFHQRERATAPFPMVSERRLMGDAIVTFTLADVLWICGAICSIATAMTVIIKIDPPGGIPIFT